MHGMDYLLDCAYPFGRTAVRMRCKEETSVNKMIEIQQFVEYELGNVCRISWQFNEIEWIENGNT